MNALLRSRHTVCKLIASTECVGLRWLSSSAPSRQDDLKSAFAEALPAQQERLKRIKKELGAEKLHDVTVNMAIGGMRGITGLLYETSLLDADEGIRFRGHTIPELQVRR